MAHNYQVGTPGRSKKSCTYPGCLRVFLRGSASFDRGFCAYHPVPDRPPAVQRWPVRAVVVASTSSASGDAYRSTVVSLVREPCLGPVSGGTDGVAK